MAAPDASALEAALRCLGRRLLSAHELRARLAQRGHDGASIDAALVRVRDYGYVDDAALAQAVARDAAQRGRGPRWIEQTLRRRGVAAELADEAATHAYEDDDDAVATATRLLTKRFAAGLEDRAAHGRAFRYLAGRGFDAAVAGDAIRRLTHDFEPGDTP